MPRYIRYYLTLFALLFFSFSVPSGCTQAQHTNEPTKWSGLRSAVVYVRVPPENAESASIRIDWKPAWISDSQRERLYWYSPSGRLLDRIQIEKNQPSGQLRLKASEEPGDYRLVIPGYSFRKYDVTIPAPLKSVIEPEKLHFSMEVPNGVTFWSGPIGTARINLKSHRNSALLHVTANGKFITKLIDDQSNSYRAHASKSVQARQQQLKIDIVDGGKFSLWLDGAPNVFSKSKSDWFYPKWAPGNVLFEIDNRVIGDTTKIGNYVEFTKISHPLKQLINDLNPSVVQSYLFEDVMAKNFSREVGIKRSLKQSGVAELFGLLSRTTRDSVPTSTKASSDFLNEFLLNRFRLNIPVDILAFVDEPNLRYRSYSNYEAYHRRLALIVRDVERRTNSKIKIAAPESSRMVNGPANQPRRFQSGIEWTRRLLSRNWDTVDIISWHMWQYRYLEALDQFPETILDVTSINEQLARDFGRPPKQLAISQTNIGSGPNTSTYQQNTHYASLWWASVVTQSINTGKLDYLMWFKSVDEQNYGKGLLTTHNGELKRKPIADAMIFLNSNLLPKTISANSTSHEVDLAAMKTLAGDVSAICVNKSKRRYQMTLKHPNWKPTNITFLHSNGIIESSPLHENTKNGFKTISLPPQSICSIKGYSN